MEPGVVWGERVGIRRLMPTDATAVRRFLSDQETINLLFEEIGGEPPPVLAIAWQIATNIFYDRPEFGIIERSGRLIGVVRLWRVSPQNRNAMLTIYVGDKSRWGKGYGTEGLRLVLRHAFEQMGLERIELHVFDFNARAVRSYEKCGFVHEGSRRKALYRAGSYHDILVMGILKNEFYAREAEWEALRETRRISRAP